MTLQPSCLLCLEALHNITVAVNFDPKFCSRLNPTNSAAIQSRRVSTESPIAYNTQKMWQSDPLDITISYQIGASSIKGLLSHEFSFKNVDGILFI